ncbi:MAG: GerW family sporulation protein [Eubacterium sp.]|nr:GerW family sporulation protein [Eubacterium sp.]
MSNQNFKETVNALFEGMDHLLSSKTVVGEPKVVGSTIIVPLVDVSFGMGAGVMGKEKTDNNNAGGLSAKMAPCAILIIKDGTSRLINVRSQDAMNKVLDMVPDAVNKISSLISSRGKEEPDVAEIIEEELNKEAETTSLDS